MIKKYFSWIPELVVIFALVLVINNFLGNQEPLINADGKGYYDYLPAVFIYGDLNFHYIDTLKTDYYDQKEYSSAYLKTFNGKQINKYFPGVAILWTPFFLRAHLYALNSDEFPADGYSYPYQKSIFHAALFYLFIGLIFLRKLLINLGFKRWVIFVVQTLLVIGTPAIIYVYKDPAFTHVYSFVLITIFAYFSHKFISQQNPKHLLLSGLILGLIIIIRPVNAMAIGIPFLFFDSVTDLKGFTVELIKKHLKTIVGFGLLMGLVVSIVPIMWYIQTGKFMVWGYQDEGFNFLDPAFFSFLFSVNKGALLVTPILFIAFFGGLWAWFMKKSYYKIFGYTGFLILITYVLSSWWSWWYGYSFGSRPMIDYYVIFAIGLATFIQYLKSVKVKIGLLILFIGLTYVNVIQAYQYDNYIILGNQMTFEKYKVIGLHIEDKYKGIFYRKKVPFSEEEVVYSGTIPLSEPKAITDEGGFYFQPILIPDSLNLDLVNYVIVEVDADVDDASAEIILVLDDTNETNFHWSMQNIFGLDQREDTRVKVNLPYQIHSHPNIGRVFIGVTPKTDEIIIHSLKVNFVHKE